jgi:hypothetical protein
MHARQSSQWRFQAGFFPAMVIFLTGQTAQQAPQEVQAAVTQNIPFSSRARALRRPCRRAWTEPVKEGRSDRGTVRALPPSPARGNAADAGKVSPVATAIRCGTGGGLLVKACIIALWPPYTASTVTAPTPCLIRKVIRGASGRAELVV